MSIGLQLSEWERISWLGAAIKSSWSKEPIHPHKINPFLRAMRKHGLLDEDPEPPATGFNLGDIGSLARSMRGD